MGKDFKSIMEDLHYLSNRYILVLGTLDIRKNQLNRFFSENIDFYIKAGNGNEDLILEAIKEYEYDVDREGFYEFKMLMSYDGGQYDEYGRCECRPYMEIMCIGMEFIQSFESRERDVKIDSLLDLFELRI